MMTMPEARSRPLAFPKVCSTRPCRTNSRLASRTAWRSSRRRIAVFQAASAAAEAGRGPVHLPVDGIAFAQDLMQRGELGLGGLAGGLEGQTLAFLDPTGLLAGLTGLERNCGDALGATARSDLGTAGVHVVLHGGGEAVAAEARGQHQWTVHRRLLGVIALERLGAQRHRQLQRDDVAGLPGAVDGEIAAGVGKGLELLPIHAGAATGGGPGRNAQIERHRHRLRGGDAERGAFLLGKARFLAQRQPLFGPAHFARNEQVDEDRVGAAEVDRVAELRKLLGAGAVAAPEGIGLGAEILPPAGLEREVVHFAAVAGMLGAEARVPQGALVVVEVAGVGGPGEQVARQLEHVVAAAALLRRAAKGGAERAGIGAPAFAVAGPAGGVAAPAHDLVQKEMRYFVVARVASELVLARGANDLADVGVDVQTLELVAVRGQGVEEGVLFGAPRVGSVTVV